MRDRWPRWVYGAGEEPDYRFSFANERTFLAWIRTALALIAGGVAIHTLALSLRVEWRFGAASALVVLGGGCAWSSWFRWARSERAMRHATALPSSRLSAFVAVGVVIVAAIVLLALL